MEFVLLVSVIIFFFAIFFVVISEKTGSRIAEKNNLEIKYIAFVVQDEINLASESSEGYYRKFRVSKDINGQAYNLSVINEMIYVKTLNNKYAIALPILPISGQVVLGENIIEKKEGIVYLNP